jgi:hypothetical protein
MRPTFFQGEDARTISSITLLMLKQNALAPSSPRRSRQNPPKRQQDGFEGHVQGFFQLGPVLHCTLIEVQCTAFIRCMRQESAYMVASRSDKLTTNGINQRLFNPSKT